MSKFSTQIGTILLLLTILFSNNLAISQDTTAMDSLPQTTDTTVTEVERAKQVYYFKLHEEIMPNAARLVHKALEEAEQIDADVVIMELDTYGGRVDIADSIRSMLLNARPLTVSYIINNAASAGALISIACDSIYMKQAATIGAVTVVNQEGTQMPDKYQSYMRSKMRATAEAQGRNPDIAEAMVDDRIALEGIIDSGEVLTFTASEALTYDFCDKIVTNRQEVLDALGMEDYEITEYVPSTMDQIFQFLLNPIVSSIVMLMIFGGIYFELQTPGVGFPLAAAILGATLYFAPLYLEGLAANWEIVLFLVGLILIGVEIFVLPGFGIAGTMGITIIIGSLTLSMIENNFFDFSLTGVDKVGIALLRVTLTLLAGVALMFTFGGSIFNSPAFKRIMLQDEQLAGAGYTILSEGFSDLKGSEGQAITDLRPSGKVEINDEIYDAMSEGGYIEVKSAIRVIGMDQNTLIVRKIS